MKHQEQSTEADIDFSVLDKARKVENKAEADAALERELARKRSRGFVVDCDGERAIVTSIVNSNVDDKENYWSVGQLITIKIGANRVVGLAYKVEAPQSLWDYKDDNQVKIHLELIGEIIASKDGKDSFTTGIASYPQMGCIAHRIRTDDLAIIYESDGDAVIKVGNLTQDRAVEAKIDLDKLLSRHFAIVGTTGVGKSTSVTLILRKIVETRPDIRVLVLDPHNEFASAFPDHAVVADASNLVLPFWLFRLEEFAEVVFRGQKGFDAEIELLRDMIPQAKERFRADAAGVTHNLTRRAPRSNLTADMPVPYRLVDLLKLIDERLGLLEGKAEKPILKSLEHKLETISTDPRFKFMFDTGQGGDIMESIISRLFRMPQEGKPICVLEMSGLPTEVVNSVVSVLCRMAFDLGMNSDGGVQTLVVCEEAHRYIPSDLSGGFWPTRQAIARIAKEGRKYGVYLGIITQRPGELDPTILSQCNTIFAMRLGNQKDQEIIRGAVTNGAKSTISFLSSIANRECIAFGEAIHTPMRMTFETILSKDLPGARIYEQQAAVKAGRDVSLSAVLRRMRQEDRKSPSVDTMEGSAGALPTNGEFVEQRAASSPADEINSIVDTAMNSTNGSRSQSVEQPTSAAKSDSQKGGGSVGGLIRSFRSN